MLEQVLRHINNRFERGVLEGTFEVSSGTLEVEGALEGQYFWVEGSVMNDGLHMYPDTTMADETFQGRVVLLAVPRAVQDLAEDISAWCESNAEVLDSPYQSESFGGYSYTRASGSQTSSGVPLSGWMEHFASDLNPWRKMSRQGW